MSGPFLRIDHVTLMVKDLKRSVEFYAGKLGFQVRGETTPEKGVKTVFLQCRDANFDLYGMVEGQPYIPERKEHEVGLVHIALKVEDVDKVYEGLVKRGVEFHVKPFYQPRSGRKIAFFKDPDGNVLHITDGESKP
ncbi:MAG: VOC family protein [Candidatus Bathyarchaeia archaeon]